MSKRANNQSSPPFLSTSRNFQNNPIDHSRIKNHYILRKKKKKLQKQKLIENIEGEKAGDKNY